MKLSLTFLILTITGVIIFFFILVMNIEKKFPQHTTVLELKNYMRRLCSDHIACTHNVTLCIVNELPGADESVKILINKQNEIGDALKPYYGEETGNKLTAFLHEQIIISAAIVKGTKQSNTLAIEQAKMKWIDNADKISEFLNGINPHWKLKELKMMMNDYLALTTDEATQRISNNYSGYIKAYGKLQNEILKMSDLLADGIVKQFPEKFKP